MPRTSHKKPTWPPLPANPIKFEDIPYQTQLQSSSTRFEVYKEIGSGINYQRKKFQNLRKDAHYKIANWLCRQYDHIILTRLNVKYMSKKKSGLGRSTRKAMLKLGHFQFRQILVQKASQYPGTKIYIGGEAYISKTCGQCGQLNYKLGSSEIFRCRFTSCGYKSDRDVNAARNIMLLYGKPLQKRK